MHACCTRAAREMHVRCTRAAREMHVRCTRDERPSQAYSADVIATLEKEVYGVLPDTDLRAVLQPIFARAKATLNTDTEKKLRANKLQAVHIPPCPRKVGEVDGSPDLCYDFPFERTMERCMELNPDFMADILSSAGARPYLLPSRPLALSPSRPLVIISYNYIACNVLTCCLFQITLTLRVTIRFLSRIYKEVKCI